MGMKHPSSGVAMCAPVTQKFTYSVTLYSGSGLGPGKSDHNSATMHNVTSITVAQIFAIPFCSDTTNCTVYANVGPNAHRAATVLRCALTTVLSLIFIVTVLTLTAIATVTATAT